MNIYEMYISNDQKFGYFVARDSWGNTIAKVIKIEGVEEGKPLSGRKPYFGNPKVTAEFYKIENAIYLDEVKSLCSPETLQNISELSCPGTYSYYLV